MCRLKTILVMLMILAVCGQLFANSWQTPTGYQYYTMDVEAVDLNEDGYLDLILGAYSYPYFYDENDPGNSPSSEYGDRVYWCENNGNQTFQSPAEIFDPVDFDIDIGVDCIDFADYDHDEDQDMLVGAVAITPEQPGGVYLLRNIDFVTNEYLSPDNLPSITGDVHRVQWVDINCDGNLDITALIVNGPLAVMFAEEVSDPGDGPPIIFEQWYYYDLTDEVRYSDDRSWNYSLTGTTMAWGDIDYDGDLDVYINNGKRVQVFRNLCFEDDLTGPNDYGLFFDVDENYSENSPFHFKAANTASFGFEDAERYNLALAVGDGSFSQGVENHYIGITVYDLDIDHLDHVWSENGSNYSNLSTYYNSYDFQIYTDLIWCSDNATSDEQDIVSVSYGVYDNTNFDTYDYDDNSILLTQRSRGKPLRFNNDGSGGFTLSDMWSSGSMTSQLPASSMEWDDFQTDFDGVNESEATGEIRNTNYGNDLYFIEGETDHPNLLYLTHFPVESIIEVSYSEYANFSISYMISDYYFSHSTTIKSPFLFS